MSDALQDVITALGTTLGSMTGLARWYADPPESLNEFPCGLAFAATGEMDTASSGWGYGLHTITINIYHSRQVLPQAIDAAKVWPHLVFAALAANQTLSAKALALVWPLRYTFGPLAYGSDTHYGVSFSLTVKVRWTGTSG